MRAAGPSRREPRRSWNLCGLLVLGVVLAWGLVLMLWVRARAEKQSIQEDALARDAFRMLNQTRHSIRREWEHLVKFVQHPDKSSNSIGESKPASEVPDGSHVHIIFSTDCKPFMDYQTLVLFHSAQLVGQKGPVTRIVSGCTKEKQEELTQLYKKLYPLYNAHFTPDFSGPHKYVYFNKPYGLKHWLEHADPPVGPEAVVALLDPDMILMRPITGEVRGMDNLKYSGLAEDQLFDRVVRGKPIAAVYGLGAPWTQENHRFFNKREICEPDSPCLTVNEAFGDEHYSVGPPYILHRDDMLRIAISWCRYAPKVHKQYPELLAEMYAYSIAAAHEQLPHLQMPNLMVSNIHMSADSEGWPLVDVLPDACAPPTHGAFFPGEALPTVLHFCQTYRAGRMGWAKRRPQLLDIFECDSGLLLEPTPDLSFLDHKVFFGQVLTCICSLVGTIAAN